MVNHVDRGKENVTSICVFENNVSGELCLEKKSSQFIGLGTAFKDYFI